MLHHRCYDPIGSFAVLVDDLGIALKIDDGATRAAETAITALLVALGVLDADDANVKAWLNPTLRNTRDKIVGEGRPAATLCQPIQV